MELRRFAIILAKSLMSKFSRDKGRKLVQEVESDLGLGSIVIMEVNVSVLNVCPLSIQLKALVNIGVSMGANNL